MKFKFPFNGVIRHRGIVQKAAQKEFFDAQAKADDKLRQIQTCFNAIDLAREKIFEMQKSGQNQSAALQLNEELIEGQKRLIEIYRKEARDLLSIAEEKREILVEATKELKAIENYKDKRFREHKAEKRRLETKQIDEIVTLRYQRRGGQ